MPRPAGEYDRLFVYRPERRFTAGPAGLNQRAPLFPAGAELWGALDVPDAAAEPILGSDRPRQRCTVRLRNYPPVRANDRLEDTGEGGLTWRVTAARRGDDELVCDCEQPEGAE